jgi:hypothetical protein
VGAPVAGESRPITLGRVLAFAAVVEVATGFALIAAPPLAISLLLGMSASSEGTRIARVAGVALLAVGVACWPGRQAVQAASPAVRAMLLYNILIALYLAALAIVRHVGGPLLWPAVVLHTVVALLLIWTGRTSGSVAAT